MELFDNLNEIRSQLFDAPADIKSAFNDVVEYFSEEKSHILEVNDGNHTYRVKAHQETVKYKGAKPHKVWVADETVDESCQKGDYIEIYDSLRVIK